MTNARKGPPSRYASFSPRWARLVLVAAVALMALGFATLPDEQAIGAVGPDGEGDSDLYRAVSDRVAGGESYYDAAGDELSDRGYATSPFVNWRLPTMALTTAALGEEGAHLLLLGLAAITLLAWAWALLDARAPLPVVIGAMLALVSALSLTASKEALWFHETWAGVLIALSLALRRVHVVISLGVAALALAIRELALAYVVAMVIAALLERRRAEALAWVGLIGAFAIALGLHATTVGSRIDASAPSNAWFDLGGWEFVVSTSLWNTAVILVGSVLALIALPLALVGAGSWDHPLGNRIGLTVAGYVTAFLVVGRPDNHYWGLVVAPLLALSLAFTPSALRALVGAARGSGQQDAPGESPKGAPSVQ